MKNIYISILALFIGMCSVTAQVGVGTSSPNENAVLEVSSTTQGMAFPRVAAMTDIPNPATGLMVFDMVGDCLAVNVGTPAAPDWKCTGSSTLERIGIEADEANIIPSIVTVEELNGIEGVSAAVLANQADYQTYIDANPDLFSSPATVVEVNAMITAVNNEKSSTTGGTLAQVGLEGDDPDTTNSVVTAAQLAAVTGVTGVDADNETAYQDYIDDNPDLFSSPATVEEVNEMIAAVNNEADAEAGENGAVSTLVKLGTEADPPNETTPTTVTAAELAAVSGVTGVDGDNEAAYQAYINENPDLFSSPATVEEVNAMIAAVNNEADAEAGENGAVSTLVKLGTEADPPNESTPTTVTAAELAAVSGVTGVDGDNEAAYQAYINENPDLFSSPATVAEVNAMIAAVNNEADAEAGENGAVSTLEKLGTEADPPNESTPTTVTAAELAAVSGVTGVEGDNEAAYQAYIDANPDLFSSPATVEEVNAMIAAVNNEADAEAGENGAVSTLVKLGTEADPPNESTPTTVTAAELAAVSGVTGVDGDNEAAYQAYINENPDLFSSPATVAEVNAMIAAVNNEADAEAGENGAVSTLEKLGTEADPPNESTPTTVTAAELAAVSGVTGVEGDNEAAYQAYIDANPDLFSSPATVAEVNAMIAAVNNEADAEAGENGAVSTLEKLGTEADPPNESTPTTVTAAELAAVSGVTGVDGDNEAAYQAYINNNPDLFSSPATVAEVNAMIAAVNANEETGGEDSILVQIGTEADAGTGTPSTVTAAQLAALTGITGVDPDNEADYQQYIADNPDAFSQPATLAEVQAMIDEFSYPEGDATFVLPIDKKILSFDAGQGGTGDVQGVIDNVANVVTYSVPYTAGSGAYAAYTSDPISLTGEAGDSNMLTISYPAGTFSSTGNIPVTVTVTDSDASFLVEKQLASITALFATFDFKVNGTSKGNLTLTASGGIPDREFGDVAHNFLYLPVTNPTTGKTWLNHNLGAHYTQVNHPDFDPTYEITDLNDHLAFGSLFQGGRYSDGHELITWTGPDNATPVNSGATNAKLPSTNRDSNAFIYSCNMSSCYPYSWMDPINFDTWNGVAAANNPCPDGYRLPTEEEYTNEVASWSSKDVSGVLASTLKLTTVGSRDGSSSATPIFPNDVGRYPTSEYRGYTVDDEYRTALLFFNPSTGFTSISTDNTRTGYPVRCIKDE